MSTKFGEMPKKQEVIKMGGIDIFEMKKCQKITLQKNVTFLQ